MASDNRTLGNFTLDDLPPAPRGVPQIEVTFDINADGILSVAAKDKATGKEQDITIASSSGLSEEEIDRMVQDAKDNEEADNKRRQEMEQANKLNALIFQAEALVAANEDKLDEASKQAIEEAINDGKSAIGNSDIAANESAYVSLETALHAVTKKLYEDQQQDPEVAPQPDDDDIIDAEYA